MITGDENFMVKNNVEWLKSNGFTITDYSDNTENVKYYFVIDKFKSSKQYIRIDLCGDFKEPFDYMWKINAWGNGWSVRNNSLVNEIEFIENITNILKLTGLEN